MPACDYDSDDGARVVTVLEQQILVLVCGIAAVALGSLGAESTLQRTVMAGAFVTCVALLHTGRSIAPTTAASLIAVASGYLLLRPAAANKLAPLAAGAVAAQWATALTRLGAPALAADVLAAATLIGVVVLTTRRSRFAPRIIREEALLLVGSLAGLLAIGPGIISGWHSALALRATPLSDTPLAIAPWPFAVVGVALALGGLYAAWKHRRRS